MNTPPALVAALALVVFSASLYGLRYLHAENSAWRSLWKTVPVGLMAVAASFFGLPPALALALAFSAAGDYFLSREDAQFPFGLGAFLIAHLLYIWLFWQIGLEAGLGWGHGAMLAYALVFGAFLWPRAGVFRLPVIAYIAVISAMVSAALLLPDGYTAVVFGSLCFAFSDSVLALEMFVIKAPRTRLALSRVVWVSYIVAQVLIIDGLR